MNEKYQQALTVIESYLKLALSKNEFAEDAINISLKRLQELVDMMKPLEFEELENEFKNTNSYFIIDSKTNGVCEVVAMNNNPKILAINLKHEIWTQLIEFEENRFYRNIWEVE